MMVRQPTAIGVVLLACFSSAALVGCNAKEESGDRTFKADWQLEPGEERIDCAREIVDEDLLINAVYPINDPGTHHGLITQIDDPSHELWGEEGIQRNCDPLTQFGTKLFGTAGGKTKEPFVFPPGIAARIKAGSEVFGNYHIYNVTDHVLTGSTGVTVTTVDESDITEEAEILLIGKLSLNVPPGGISTHIGECPLPAAATVFAIAMHMHFYAIHGKVIAHSSIVGDTVVYDQDWDFDLGHHLVGFPEVPMAQGDVLEIQCTYNNTTDRNLIFADSATEEMCTAAIYQYPANLNGVTFCAN
jgi:hypothetical protein